MRAAVDVGAGRRWGRSRGGRGSRVLLPEPPTGAALDPGPVEEERSWLVGVAVAGVVQVSPLQPALHVHCAVGNFVRTPGSTVQEAVLAPGQLLQGW